MTVINRFLSTMAWCDDKFAIAQHGWSGKPVPVSVQSVTSPSRRHMTTFSSGRFRIPRRHGARSTARRARQNAFVSYAVLNYYKIIEIPYPGKEAARKWFLADFEASRTTSKADDDISRFLALCGNDHRLSISTSCAASRSRMRESIRSPIPDDAHEIVVACSGARDARTGWRAAHQAGTRDLGRDARGQVARPAQSCFIYDSCARLSSNSPKLTIFTLPSGKRAVISSEPPSASM